MCQYPSGLPGVPSDRRRQPGGPAVAPADSCLLHYVNCVPEIAAPPAAPLSLWPERERGSKVKEREGGREREGRRKEEGGE